MEENFGVAQKGEEKSGKRCTLGIALENVEGQRANEEEEEVARGEHGQLLEETFAVAQEERERAARGAHEESP